MNMHAWIFSFALPTMASLARPLHLLASKTQDLILEDDCASSALQTVHKLRFWTRTAKDLLRLKTLLILRLHTMSNASVLLTLQNRLQLLFEKKIQRSCTNTRRSALESHTKNAQRPKKSIFNSILSLTPLEAMPWSGRRLARFPVRFPR